MTRPGGRTHAVPGGTSALRPPPREQLAPPPATQPVDPPDEPPAFVEHDEPPVRPAPASDVDVPPPPPAHRRHPREQLNTKIRVDLRTRLNAFVGRHDSTLQGVLEAALDEYMTRRGWSWDDFHRAARRR